MKHTNRLVNMAIEICADNIFELRKCDVERAMECAERHGRETYLDLIEFIAANRPDLVPVVVKYKEDSVPARMRVPSSDGSGRGEEW